MKQTIPQTRCGHYPTSPTVVVIAVVLFHAFVPSCGEEEVNIAHTPRCEHAMLHSMFGTFRRRRPKERWQDIKERDGCIQSQLAKGNILAGFLYFLKDLINVYIVFIFFKS